MKKKMQCHSYNSPSLVDITEVLSITEVVSTREDYMKQLLILQVK